MSYPHIDLTDAAKFYGLSFVPPVVPAYGIDLIRSIFQGSDPEAGYLEDDRVIEVWPDLFDDVTDYDQSRFASVGVGPLDTHGKVQFILAHELWHARQDELHSRSFMKRQTRLSNKSSASHDSAFIERDADQHAATAYTLVKIGD